MEVDGRLVITSFENELATFNSLDKFQQIIQ